jgi:hypothetical protein
MYLNFDPSLEHDGELPPDAHYPDLEALYQAVQPGTESDLDGSPQNEPAGSEFETNVNEETERVHESKPGRTENLINRRKALRHEADQLRIEALNLAIQWGVLDLFPELKKWLADAQRQGLLNQPPPAGPGQPKEEIIERIGALESQAFQNDHDADALTPEIVKG